MKEIDNDIVSKVYETIKDCVLWLEGTHKNITDLDVYEFHDRRHAVGMNDCVGEMDRALKEAGFTCESIGGYRWWWTNDSLMCDVAWTEGDVYIMPCPTRDVYEKELLRGRLFYKKN